jgi:polyether ionophore transport system permease protein
VLLLIALFATAGAAVAFERRDLGSPLLTPPTWSGPVAREPSRASWWRIPVVREIYERRFGLLVWCAGMVALAVIFAAITKAVIQPLISLPTLIPYFGSVLAANFYPAVLGYVWFNFAELLFAGFAIAQVGRWAAEDVDGRLELILSQPRSRPGVVVERLTAATIAAALIAAAGGIGIFYASRSQGIELDSHRLATAALMLVPFALDFAAAGMLLAAWNPRAAVGLIGGIAFAGYLDTEVGPLLKLPGWIQDLSPFKLFGTPLVSGLDGRNLTIMLLIAVAAFGSSILAFGRRDVGS